MSVQIHRCRFMDCERPGVSAIAFNYPSVGPDAFAPPDLRVAVGRMNGDIEIWNPHYWSCDLVIPGAEGRTVEDLVWICDSDTNQFRLFSVGGSDTIVEWDLCTGTPAQMVRSDAGVVWALAVSPDGTQLAASTELGTIVIYEVSSNQIEPVKRLGGADTSLVSLAWKSSTEVVAGGSDGKLKVWSISHNRIISTMNVDKRRTRQKHGISNPGQDDDGEETVVWSLLNLPKTNQMVSGDSNGFIKVWDTRNWTLQQSFAAHEADVLCLASNWQGDSLFSSGLDQKIILSKLTDIKAQRWTVMSSSVAHTHDIRSLAAFEAGSSNFSYLLSGGLEPAFVINNIDQLQSGSESHHRIISRGKVQAASAGDFVVEWNERQAQVWQILPTSAATPSKGRRLIARARISDEFITSCCYDPEHGLLICGSLLKTRIFKLTESENGGKTNISLIKTLEFGVKSVAFTEPERILCVTVSDSLILWDIESDSVAVTIAEDEEGRHDGSKLTYWNQISLLAVNQGLVAISRFNNQVNIFTLDGKHICKLPTLPTSITALSFLGSENVVVCCADRSIFEFSAVKGNLAPWSKLNTSNKMPKSLQNQFEPALGVFTDPSNGLRAWIWGPSWLATIDFDSKLPIRNDDTQSAVVESGEGDGLPNFYITNRYKPLFFASAVTGSVLVAERPDKAVDAARFWSNRKILF